MACLRPATLSDWSASHPLVVTTEGPRLYKQLRVEESMMALYNAEWRLRGFRRSP